MTTTDDGGDDEPTDSTDRIDQLARRVAEHDERLTRLGRTVAASNSSTGGPLSRRSLLKVVGLGGLFTAVAGEAAADPQGQVGTETDPLRALYTQELNGAVTGGTAVTDLLGENLSVDDGTLTATDTIVDTDTHVAVSDDGSTVVGDADDINFAANLGVTADGDGSVTVDAASSADTHTDVSASGTTVVTDVGDIDFAPALSVTDDGDGTVTVTPPWVDGDGDDLLAPTGGATGIEGITTVRSGGELHLVVNGSDGLLLTPPDTAVSETGVGGDPPNVIAGHPDNHTGGKAVKGATIAGGGSSYYPPNEASADAAAIGGGRGNVASAQESTVGGGLVNEARARIATVSGGWDNVATAQKSTVGGGVGNKSSGKKATVAGGEDNVAAAEQATVSGGLANEARDVRVSIGGGSDNVVTEGGHATIAGGDKNTIKTDGRWATIGGGSDHTVTGAWGTVPGGENNTVDAKYGFAAGRRAHTNGKEGAVVIGDSSFTEIKAQNTNEVRSQMPIYAPAFNTTSARAKKSGIEPVDPGSILEGVRDLDVASWELEDSAEDGRHIGPMAADFADAFDLEDDGSIASVDADGVAMAAIQGLSAELDDRDERIDDLEGELDARATRIDELESDLEAKTDRIDELAAENEALRERLTELEQRLAAVENGAP